MANLIQKKGVPVFSVGTHTDSKGKQVTVTEADLDGIITNFNKDLSGNYHPPVVIGHPKMDDPRFGDLSRISKEGGHLFADIGVVPELDAALKQGAYPDRSLSLQRLNDGTFRIKHLGLLGVVPPAVQGLPSYQFAADGGDEECVTVDFSEEASMDGWQAQHSEPAADTKTETQKEEEEMGKIEELQQQLDAERAARLALEKKNRQHEFSAFCEGLAKEGKLTPAMQPAVLDFMEILTGVETFDFAEQDGDQAKRVAAAPVEKFKAFLAGLPKVVEFSEFANRDDAAHRSADDTVVDGIASASPKK